MSLSQIDKIMLETFYNFSGNDINGYHSSLENLIYMKAVNLVGKKVFNEAEPRILDVGCGTGEILAYINEEGLNISGYKGIDIREKAISEAKKSLLSKHSSYQASFELCDFLDFESDKVFDVIFALGLIGVVTQNKEKYLNEVLQKMYSLSNHSFIFNIHREDPNLDPMMFSLPQSNVLEMCYSFNPEEVRLDTLRYNKHNLDFYSVIK